MATQKETSRTTERAAEKAHETVDRVAEKAAAAEEKIRDRAASADEQVRERAHQARDRSDELINNVVTFVRENPLTSLGLAFAAGSLFSSFNRRR
ncbi:hypothetical protein M0534_11260 [Methylonatrum kenyense]|uniref:hypothetical protein n=1 Tax=Methylonatrum kenyense TaxID=455253 RepID=UPI0020BF426B|nr:hypothetical protein [Methylonatrum kenyense]MCK8516897.1 hypothetical protein [Methylonatrum kenyense]